MHTLPVSFLSLFPQIFDGPDTESPFLGRHCTSRPRFTINSKGNSLFLIYRTSRNTAKHDFQMVYRTEKSVEDRMYIYTIAVFDFNNIGFKFKFVIELLTFLSWIRCFSYMRGVIFTQHLRNSNNYLIKHMID